MRSGGEAQSCAQFHRTDSAAGVAGTEPEGNRAASADRFDRVLDLAAGAPAGILFFVGLVLMPNRPKQRSNRACRDLCLLAEQPRSASDRTVCVVAPLIAFLLLFFGAGLKRRLEQGNGDAGHGSVAFGGALAWRGDLRARRDARSCDDERRA